MKTEDLLDSYTIDGFEVEISLIETVGRGIKTLCLMQEQHIRQRDDAEIKAKEALDQGDPDKHQRWMAVFWKENRAVSLIEDSLAELNMSKGQEGRKDETEETVRRKV